MSNKAANRRAIEFCDPAASEIRALARLLDEAGVCRNGLSDLEKACGGFYESNTTWRCQFTKLIFALDPAENPSTPAQVADLQCTVSFRASGEIPESDDILNDPFGELEVNITLRAKTASGGVAEMAWHLDRHEDKVGANLPLASHPRYHWHCGRRHMTDFIRSSDSPTSVPILFIDGPRLAHPPLDAALLIDIVLSNFLPSTWKQLQKKQRYREIIRSSQRRFWRPYAAATRHWFVSAISEAVEKQEPWDPVTIWPSLVL